MGNKVLCPPRTILRDISDPSGVNINEGLDVKAFHKQIRITIEIAVEIIKKDIKKEIEEAIHKKENHGRRYTLAEIINRMKDILAVIRLIHETYYKGNQPELLCAHPLNRLLVESVFTIAILLRKPGEMFPMYEKYSWANDYYRRIYHIEETKDLPRFQEGNQHTYYCCEKMLIGKTNASPEDEFSPEELKKNEEAAKMGENLKNYRFPTPKIIISIVEKNNPTDRILYVLKRLYIEYQWLCSYTHGDLNALLISQGLKLDHPQIDKNKMKENEITDPVIVLCFLSVLVALTDIIKWINKPEKLAVRLSKDWNFFENNSLLGILFWDNWAKNNLGIII
jgi:hypothetical protein